MKFKNCFLLLCLSFLLQGLQAQPGSRLQDSTLNNLVHPSGYRTGQLGALGSVKKTGSSKQAMILVAGLGFSSDDLNDLIRQFKKEYTIYAVTPAGFGGTPAPPMPDTSVKYAAQTWTNGIADGIVSLVEKEHLKNPILVAHFVTATQVALTLALEHPGKIGKIIIIGGSPYRYYPGQKDGAYTNWAKEKVYTPQQRAKLVEDFWAPKWFKTVTKKTWDDNMWTPNDYCKDSMMGKKLFRESADVPLPVMVRYLIEWMAFDVSDRYRELKLPTLILQPDFKDLVTGIDSTNTASLQQASAKQYLIYFHQVAWRPAATSGNQFIHIQTIPGTRLFMWYDNPKAVYRAIRDFLKQ